MSIAELEMMRRGSNYEQKDRIEWKMVNRPVAVLLCPEAGGGYSIHALDLPGIVSQGETENEAISNVEDALAGAIAVYKESGDEIPWERVVVDEIPSGSKELWVFVNV